MILRRSLLGSCALALASLHAVPAGAISAGVDVGWWTRSPAQSAPEGGFAVASAPDGPVTVAAVLIDLGTGDATSATLRATADGGLGAEVAAIQVCPTTGTWQPEAGGDLDDAPTPACDQVSIPFEPDGETATWEADISALLSSGAATVSLALVPAPPAEGQLGAPLFDVRFAAPQAEVLGDGDSGRAGAEDIRTGAAPAPREDERGSGTSEGGAVAGNRGRADGTTPTQPPAAAPAPSSALPASGAGADVADVEDPAVEDSRVVAAPGDAETAGEQAFVASTVSSEEARWGQALFFVLLSAALGATAAVGNRQLRLRGVAG